MMKSADLRQRNHWPKARRLHRPARWRVLLQRKVRPGLVIIRHKRFQVTIQTGLVEDDHMVDALAPNRPNHAFDVGPLPGGTRRREHFFDAQVPDLLGEVGSEDAIPIPQKISRHLLKRERLSQLLSGPLGRRMRGDIEMHDPSAVVSQHHVQHLKANGRHREEVDRNRGLHVVFQEGPPCLGRRIPTVDHVFAHAGLAGVNAESEELPVDARSAPKRVLAAHPPNQLTDFLRHRRAAGLAAANLPSPKQSKSLAVPRYDGFRYDDAKSRVPFGPSPTKPSPKEPVEPVQSWLLDRALHHAKLMAESQDLKLQRRSSAEDRHYGREQCR